MKLNFQNVIGNNARKVDEQEEEEEENDQQEGQPQKLHMQEQMQKPDVAHHPRQQFDNEEYDGEELNRNHQV